MAPRSSSQRTSVPSSRDRRATRSLLSVLVYEHEPRTRVTITVRLEFSGFV